MAIVYSSQSDEAKVLEYYEKSSAIRLKTVGAEHPSVASSLLTRKYEKEKEKVKKMQDNSVHRLSMNQCTCSNITSVDYQ